MPAVCVTAYGTVDNLTQYEAIKCNNHLASLAQTSREKPSQPNCIYRSNAMPKGISYRT